MQKVLDLYLQNQKKLSCIGIKTRDKHAFIANRSERLIASNDNISWEIFSGASCDQFPYVIASFCNESNFRTNHHVLVRELVVKL